MCHLTRHKIVANCWAGRLALIIPKLLPMFYSIIPGKPPTLHQAFGHMGVQASCGWPLIEESSFVFHMLPYEFFI